MSSGYPVVIRAEVEAIGISNEIDNQSTTPAKKTFVSGLMSLAMAYMDMGASVGKCIYIVFDALDDADAATKLGVATSRETVFINERRTFQFSADTLCYRIDIKTQTAETGASKLAIAGKVPL